MWDGIKTILPVTRYWHNPQIKTEVSIDKIQLGIDLDEVVELVKQKEVRKTISPHNILGNWELAKQDKANEHLRIKFTEELADEAVEEQIKRLRFGEISKQIKSDFYPLSP